MRFRRRPQFETYNPGRKDARANEARAMLSMRRTLDGLDAHGLSCTFNLKPATAEMLIQQERRRRGV